MAANCGGNEFCVRNSLPVDLARTTNLNDEKVRRTGRVKVAVLGHDQPLDRLPAKMRCPGCESGQELRWFVPAEPDPAGTTAAVAAPVKLRPPRLSEAQKKFRVIEGWRPKAPVVPPGGIFLEHGPHAPLNAGQ